MTHRPQIHPADQAMVAWAAYRGEVTLDDGNRAVLVNWARRGVTARIRIGNRHYTLPKARITGPCGHVLINGTVHHASAAQWPTPTMLDGHEGPLVTDEDPPT